jgi:hypothetical protein
MYIARLLQIAQHPICIALGNFRSSCNLPDPQVRVSSDRKQHLRVSGDERPFSGRELLRIHATSSLSSPRTHQCSPAIPLTTRRPTPGPASLPMALNTYGHVVIVVEHGTLARNDALLNRSGGPFHSSKGPVPAVQSRGRNHLPTEGRRHQMKLHSAGRVHGRHHADAVAGLAVRTHGRLVT